MIYDRIKKQNNEIILTTTPIVSKKTYKMQKANSDDRLSQKNFTCMELYGA